MKKALFSALIFFALMSINAQNPEWVYYTHGKEIRAIVEDGHHLWIGTTGGLIRYNRLNGASTHMTTTNSPLPGNNVLSLCIDHQGSLWLSTVHGLTVHNGKRWNTFTKDNSLLPSNYIYHLAVGSDGTILIGTLHGLTKYKDGQWITYDTLNSDLPDNRINSILPLQGDTIWISVALKKLVKMAGTQIIDSVDFTGFPYDFIIRSLSLAENGDLWISTSAGLAKYNGDSTQLFSANNSSIPTNNIRFTVEGAPGELWIGTYCNGLIHFKDTTWTVYNPHNQSFPSSLINMLIMDQDNKLWIATADIGLLEFEQGIFTSHQIDNSVFQYSHEIVQTINTDHSGTTWMGTKTGLVGMNDHEWTLLPLKDPGYFNIPLDVRALAIDHNNVMWAGGGSSNKLFRIEQGTYTILNTYHNYGTSYGRISSIAADHRGNLWITIESHLYLFDGNVFTLISNENSGYQGGQNPRATVDRNGVLWILDIGRITRYDGTTWTTYDQSNSPLPDTRFLTLVTDTAGELWIGTDGHGIIHFDGMFWNFYTPANSIFPLTTVQELALDHNNTLWAIGRGSNYYLNGVVRLNGIQDVTHFTAENSPLPTNSIVSLHVDPANNKWFGISAESSLQNTVGVTVYNETGLKLSDHQPQIKKESFADIWPNPFQDVILVSVPSLSTIGVYQITDMQGRIVLQGQITENKTTINATTLPSGMYLFTLESNGLRFSQKIIKTL